MALPKTLKNFVPYVDGVGQLRKCDELELPKLTNKTEELRAGGMDAPVEIDQGMEALTATSTYNEYDPSILKHFGQAERAGLPVVFRGAAEDGSGTVQSIIVTTRGGVKEQDLGSWRSGEKAQLKLMHSFTYYKLEIDGQTIHEIDVENMVRIINGVDQLAGQRAALGL